MICIVSGPSCSGKSTFLASPEAQRLSSLPLAAPVVFPPRLRRPAIKPPCYFHYNILRPASAWFSRDPYDFHQDRPWRELTRSPLPKAAIVLIASRRHLQTRMNRRRFVGENPTLGFLNPRYKNRRWMGVLGSVDLEHIYHSWLLELKRHGIPAILVDASDDAYKVLDETSLRSIPLNH